MSAGRWKKQFTVVDPLDFSPGLMRMDTTLTEADGQTLETDTRSKRLALRCIDAELAGYPFNKQPGEPVKLKLAAYQFQKYGMIEGRITHLSADASDNQQQGNNKTGSNLPFVYRALIDLKAQHLIADGVRHALTPGMQVTAEIHLCTRTVLEYLLSPVRRAFHKAGRER